MGPASPDAQADALTESPEPALVETPPEPQTSSETTPTVVTDEDSPSFEDAEAYAESKWGIPLDIDFDPEMPSFNIDIELPDFGVQLTNIGAPDTDQHVELTSPRIDDRTARNAGTGFCIIGMASENPSGVSYDIDAETNSVNATIDPTPDTHSVRDRAYDAQSIVDACADYPGKNE
jgi:hypothetical protein